LSLKATKYHGLFCRYKPFYIVEPSISDRRTCECMLHCNFRFLVKKLHIIKLLNSQSATEVAESMDITSEVDVKNSDLKEEVTFCKWIKKVDKKNHKRERKRYTHRGENKTYD